jgi:hypothetical protein
MFLKNNVSIREIATRSPSSIVFISFISANKVKNSALNKAGAFQGKDGGIQVMKKLQE